MSGEKFHRKMGVPFQITSIFPKKQLCFTPNSGFLYCFRFIPCHKSGHGYHTREHGSPKRKHKSKRKETDIAPQKRSFLEDTFLFKALRKINDCINHLIISLLGESRLGNLPDSKSSNYFLSISLLPPILYIFIYILYIIN